MGYIKGSILTQSHAAAILIRSYNIIVDYHWLQWVDCCGCRILFWRSCYVERKRVVVGSLNTMTMILCWSVDRRKTSQRTNEELLGRNMNMRDRRSPPSTTPTLLCSNSPLQGLCYSEWVTFVHRPQRLLRITPSLAICCSTHHHLRHCLHQHRRRWRRHKSPVLVMK